MAPLFLNRKNFMGYNELKTYLMEVHYEEILFSNSYRLCGD